MMKKTGKALLLMLLGIFSVVSCKSGTDKDVIVESDNSSETIHFGDNKIISLKTEVCLEGLNKSLDLASCFKFEGEASVDDMSFYFFDETDESNEIIRISGHTVTSIGYGTAIVMSGQNENSHAIISDAQFRSVTVRVLDQKHLIGSFDIKNGGTSDMKLEIKEDGKFTFTRSEGTFITVSKETKTVTAATVNGSYAMNEEGIFSFTPDDSSKAYAQSFNVMLEYDKADGSEYHLGVQVPYGIDEIDSLPTDFVVKK